MIGKLLAAFIGNRIDRADGKGGVKGAVVGLAVERLLTRLGPIGWVLAALFLVLRFFWRLIFPKRKVRYVRS
ncbi:hypothetical protein P6144_15390 [Sphingomonas sp. HITSZ_GF]|uniref:hypothetical protein n=1 Tax=Sphingomonas sp. HITSZ_GF TaxID=3037247 RepID=UPI00240D3495|nr:hypothetical protein [Sphingomonas sp. HITSZ_GF]MDG2535043.1 hypothetical protein [Sphingomonas sp. HITSZ_GF]